MIRERYPVTTIKPCLDIWTQTTRTSNKSLTLLESRTTDKQVSRLYRNLSDQAVQVEQIEEEQQDKINTLSKQLSDLSLDLENEREKVRQLRRDLKMMKAQVSDRDIDIN